MKQIFPIHGKRIFVAGHRGMLGCSIVQKVQESGGEVLHATRQELDLTNREDTALWIANAKPDAVIMAAARIGGIEDHILSPAEMCMQNLAIALSTIDGAHRANVQRFLYIASSAVYPMTAPQPLREADIRNGEPDPSHKGYAAAKQAGIALCQAYSQQHGRDYFVALSTNLFGPCHSRGEKAHVIPALMQRIAQAAREGRSEINIWGSGSPKRDFLHVNDCAAALLHVIQIQSGFDCVNIGSGEEISIRSLARNIANLTGFDGKLVFDASKPEGAPRRLLDISKLKQMGWNDQGDFREQLSAVFAAQEQAKQ